VIAQATVPILSTDTEEALAQRILQAEHRLYPATLAQLLR
jgi:folate-dependent phosphoribosylglycinamide formyltransferase PurN